MTLKSLARPFCCECDKVVTLSGMRKHVKTWHQMTFTQYNNIYGNPRMQIIHLVYHKCAYCQSSIVLDSEDLSKHLKKKHQTSYKEYIIRYMAKAQPQNSGATPHKNTASLNQDSATQHQNTATLHQNTTMEKTSKSYSVVIRCDQCPRTFKLNIQLKIHKRKHSSEIV